MTAEIVISDPGEVCLVKSYRIVRKNIRNLCTWMMIQGLYVYGEVSSYLSSLANEYVSTPESPVYTPPVRTCHETSVFVGPNVDEHVLSATITHRTSGETYDVTEHLKTLRGFPSAKNVITSYDANLDPDEHGVDIITSSGDSRHFRNQKIVTDDEGEDDFETGLESESKSELTSSSSPDTSADGSEN